ncbi:Glutathione hydrolase proenzyme [Pseudomonas sp. IT-196MI5]|uniref:gamma-glutamyltransferase n=1 Tax=Pseudomonas sp. IT-196MI5 TaxID=3026440 RepID=UPI0039DFE380
MLFNKFKVLLSGLLFLAPVSVLAGEKSVGAVAAGHPLAAEAGMSVLKNGGNAFDAAVAVASTLNVVEPMMSGIGGYGSILIFDAKHKQIRYLNGSGKFPKKTNSDFMRPPVEGYKNNRLGAKSVSTPGNVNSWYELHRSYGAVPWEKLFTSAIQHAEQGYQLSSYSAQLIADNYDNFSDYARSFYGQGGKPLQPGNTLRQVDLGASLRVIAQEGPKAFYEGEIARRIDQEMKDSGGFLSLEDLRSDKAEWWAPSEITYKGYNVSTMGVPGNGFTSLFIMGVMEQFNFGQIDYGSPSYFHTLAEAQKKSVAVRLTHSGMPEAQLAIRNEILTADNFRQVKKSIDLERSSEFTLEPGSEHENTTHFVIADRWGNVVSATQTLGNGFGSKIMVEGTGIWLNNSMAFSTFEPKGNPMDPVAGKYKLSSNSPMIIMREGRPWAALGTPGGHTIPQNAAQVAINAIDRGMTMQEAIDAPKVAYIEDKDEMRVESSMPEEVVRALKTKGHRLATGAIGNAMGIRFHYGQDGISYDVGVDQRRDWHTAISNF